MFCQLQVYSKMNLLYIYPLFFRFFFHIGHHRVFSRGPWATQQVLLSYYFIQSSVCMSIPIFQFNALPPAYSPTISLSSWTWRGVSLKTTSVFFSLSVDLLLSCVCVCVFRAMVGICLHLCGCLFMFVCRHGTLFVRTLLSFPSPACQRSMDDL